VFADMLFACHYRCPKSGFVDAPWQNVRISATTPGRMRCEIAARATQASRSARPLIRLCGPGRPGVGPRSWCRKNRRDFAAARVVDRVRRLY